MFINGGIFKHGDTYNALYATNSTVNITGGEFYGMEPSKNSGSANIYVNGGSVSISGGYIYGGTSAVNVKGGASATIDGGIMEAKTALLAEGEGTTVTINGGTLEGLESISAKAIDTNKYATVTINDGTFKIVAGKVCLKIGGSYNSVYHPAQLIVNGGDFNGRINNYTNATTLINDGTFNAVPIANTSDLKTQGITFAGGIYTEDITVAKYSDSIAEGSKVVKLADGNYQIMTATQASCNHNMESWAADATSHWHQCPTCGLVQDKAKHELVELNLGGMTAVKVEYCPNCGYIKTTPTVLGCKLAAKNWYLKITTLMIW